MADGLLNICKRSVCGIRPPKNLDFWMSKKVGLDNLEIALRNQTIRIKHHHPFALCPFKTKVSGESLSGVLLPEIPNIQPVGETLHNVFCVLRAPVFNHEHLEVGEGLPGEALEELQNLIWAVEQRNDDGKAHGQKYNGPRATPCLNPTPIILDS